MLLTSPEWRADCQKWCKRLLTGEHAHWCAEWDFLPMDETCAEWPCGCDVKREGAYDVQR